MSTLSLWALRALWLALPFAMGPAFACALGPSDRPFQVVSSIGLWVFWAVGLLCVLVPRTTSLTFVRVLAPAAVLAAVWAAVAGPGGDEPLVALAFAAVTSIVAFLPGTGDRFVDGSSYGYERRMLLRAPLPLLTGPVELAWTFAVAGVASGPLLLAAHQWVAGAVALVVGVPIAIVCLRALHGLARRWVVFVPAGLVLHDPLTLADPVLFTRQLVANLAAAPAGTDALDLSHGAPGLALELTTTEPVVVVLRDRREKLGHREQAQRVLFTPSRPGALLAEARERRIRVG